LFAIHLLVCSGFILALALSLSELARQNGDTGAGCDEREKCLCAVRSYTTDCRHCNDSAHQKIVVVFAL
jgi:hypothetical protein